MRNQLQAFFVVLFSCCISALSFAQDHLMFSEIVIQRTESEFFEIHNPTSQTIDLSNYYVTDATYVNWGNYYYNIVTGEKYGGDQYYDFHARFPDAATIQPGEYQTIAMNGDSLFFDAYGVLPTYELAEDSTAGSDVPDMREALPGSIAEGISSTLYNGDEVLILYYWDGLSDLVQDVDYLLWDDAGAVPNEAVDKTGISIDGPDADSELSTYLDDTPIASQAFCVSPGIRVAAHRVDFTEGTETKTGGNGIFGHDETSENLNETWTLAAPTPNGPFVENYPPVITSTPITEAFVDLLYQYQVTAEDRNGDILTFSLDTGTGFLSIDHLTGLVSGTPSISDLGIYSAEITVDDGNGNLKKQYYPVYVRESKHLMISEIVVSPTAAEFFEIHNPTTETIDLSNYYVTDATYANSGTYYYNIVTGEKYGGDGFSDFHARFPDGATIQPGEYQTITLEGDSLFFDAYGILPTYELAEDSTAGSDVPDMLEALPGSIAQGISSTLYNGDEVLILYYWEGLSDLVQDVDYLLWDDAGVVPNEAVDKTGISIDGPDADSEHSTYLDDTPIASQAFCVSPDPYMAAHRVDFTEGTETKFGGNGITGHDETSENLNETWTLAVPTPNEPFVGNYPPIVTSTPITEAFVDLLYQYQVTAEDRNGDILTFSLNTGAGFLSIDNQTGLVSGTPSISDLGIYMAEITVDDGNGNLSKQIYPLYVRESKHLMFSEIVVQPTEAEFFEIHNPTSQTIDLANYYVTDATYANSGIYYYNIVTGEKYGGGKGMNFHACFPEGAAIESGEYQTVATTGDSSFFATYGVLPTYELLEDSTGGSDVPNMREAMPGSIRDCIISTLYNSDEVLILYYWDGLSDLVQDVDYVLWDDAGEVPNEAVDKTGISIDGPDAGSEPSTYLDDTPIASQAFCVSPGIGVAAHRVDFTEGTETKTGGNGINGHNETSENLNETWTLGVPTPNALFEVNYPPVITSIPITEAFVDLLYQYQVTADDPNGDSLTYTLNPEINFLSIGQKTGVLSGTPAIADSGTHSITITVDDGHGGIGTQSFELKVAVLPPQFYSVLINEIMYNPQEIEDDTTEFIELYNHDSLTVDLSEWAIAAAVQYIFPTGTKMNPGEYLVIADDTIAIKNYYGSITRLHQWTRGNLNNSGEAIILKNEDQLTIDSVHYADDAPWPLPPDGAGQSLELASPFLDNSLACAWLTSLAAAGTPGYQNSVFLAVTDYPPATVKLISPDADTVSTVIVFNWYESFDFDSDELSYTLNIKGANLDAVFSGLSDTTFQYDITNLDYLETSTVDWSVSVSDNVFTVKCDQPHTFITPSGTGLSGDKHTVREFRLLQNYPNPFNPVTTIKYELINDTDVNITIFNVRGQIIRNMVNTRQKAGRHQIVWDAQDDAGSHVPSGVYVYKIKAGSLTKSAKMILIR